MTALLRGLLRAVTRTIEDALEPRANGKTPDEYAALVAAYRQMTTPSAVGDR